MHSSWGRPEDPYAGGVYSDAHISQFRLLHICLTNGWLFPEFSTQNLNTDFVDTFAWTPFAPDFSASFSYLYMIFPREAIPLGAGKEGIKNLLIKLLNLALSIEIKALDFKKES